VILFRRLGIAQGFACRTFRAELAAAHFRETTLLWMTPENVSGDLTSAPEQYKNIKFDVALPILGKINAENDGAW
jgi:hypothetical protein